MSVSVTHRYLIDIGFGILSVSHRYRYRFLIGIGIGMSSVSHRYRYRYLIGIAIGISSHRSQAGRTSRRPKPDAGRPNQRYFIGIGSGMGMSSVSHRYVIGIEIGISIGRSSVFHRYWCLREPGCPKMVLGFSLLG